MSLCIYTHEMTTPTNNKNFHSQCTIAQAMTGSHQIHRGVPQDIQSQHLAHQYLQHQLAAAVTISTAAAMDHTQMAMRYVVYWC